MKKQLLLILGVLFLSLSSWQISAQKVLRTSIAAATDDMEEYATGNVGAFDEGSSDLEMTTEGGGTQIIGLRFSSVSLPKNAIITKAYIQFRADESHSGATNLTLKIQDNDNPGTFTANDKISTRTLVKDSVLWNNIPAWTTGDAGEAQKTPDLSALLKKVISRSGWASGNSLVFVVSGVGKRVADSFDDTEAARKAAELVIEYTVPISAKNAIADATDDMEEYVTGNVGTFDVGSSDLEMTTEGGGTQIIGLRFSGVKVPQGALITRAYVQFRADESHSGATTLVLKAQNADNPGTFTTADKISTRPLTQDSVRWADIPAWTTGDAGDAQRTPDLTKLVQTIVNRGGWASGNAMVFVVSGTGKRVADSFDDTEAAKKPAELVIEYLRPITLKVAISDGTDDMEEYVTGGSIGTFDVGSSDLEMTTEGGGTQIIGLRFNGIKVPQGTNIASASIQFRADESHSGATSLVLRAQAADNPGTFTTNDKISTRTLTADSVSWAEIPAWTTGDAGAAQRTPELKGLVQSVVNRSAWASGNSMVFVIKGTGKRVADSFDDTEAARKPAELTLVYYSGEETGTEVRPKYPIGSFPLTRGGQWKYNDQGEKLDGKPWAAEKYPADTLWNFGGAKLGYGQAGLTTTTSFGTDANKKFTTTYFRNTFKTSNTAAYDSLVFYALVNDGAVVYINGTEVQRINMRAGAVGFDTLAASAATPNQLTQYRRFVVANTLMNNDTNTIAVELHLATANAAALVFDLEVTGKAPQPAIIAFPIPKQSSWSAFDLGREPSGDWKSLNYEDRGWLHGPGVLGYGDPVSTLLSFGDDTNNKYITTYFRKKFTVADLAAIGDSLLLGLRRDDGAVVYINGTEVARSNMPSGAITYSTFSGGNTGTETAYNPFVISKNVLVQGTNVIAVEVHQSDLGSSDMTFDLELKAKPSIPAPASGCEGSNDAHISCFTSVLPNTKNQLFNIPSSHKFQVLVQAREPYTLGGNVSANFDFTGYVPENGSSTKGHLSINYEAAPGGVGMYDVSYNATSKLWKVDTSRAIDFSGVAGTVGNCSGTVTPWGTIITCEETRLGTDANGDGYIDFGWCIEIDPKTNKVVEYGTGKPQKLWALGRASHENVVIKKDSVTLYWGEDAGNGAVYKFIADKKADLSSGKLYVLKVTGGLPNGEAGSSNGVWIQVPNTTQADRNNTYQLALNLGATTFAGVEDIEINPIDGMLYFAVKSAPSERVYRFKDDGATVSGFETYVGGGDSYYINNGQSAIFEPWGAGNDNLTFDDRGNLYVLQDGSQDHIWLVRNGHSRSNPKIELFATTPIGCEPTGMTFSPDFKFMFLSLQEPSSTNTATLKDASGRTITFNRSTALVIARSENLGSTVPVREVQPILGGLEVYPNPTQGNFTMKFNLKEAGAVNLEVFDLAGKRIKVQKIEANSGLNYLSTDLQEKGMHILKLSSVEGIRVAKIMVNK
ncbi:MAG: DUF839 domain-containing protein [Haliscomenobacter sp.]|uniref:alkaline phosphatase PhoX n=1 Tax=Haliscomenobacter sp. TaxID=2717303 RepID=UPI0029A62A61|nr:alkaline phosphatase PhoX [Haliscomenobacter sp.]MDX2067323.1 DUF839 domain-containing protein [Haliscomenobacter sp.]